MPLSPVGKPQPPSEENPEEARNGYAKFEENAPKKTSENRGFQTDRLKGISFRP